MSKRVWKLLLEFLEETEMELLQNYSACLPSNFSMATFKQICIVTIISLLPLVIQKLRVIIFQRCFSFNLAINGMDNGDWSNLLAFYFLYIRKIKKTVCNWSIEKRVRACDQIWRRSMLIHIDRRVISETRIREVGSQISGSRYFSRINGRVSFPRTNFRSEIDLFVDRSFVGKKKKNERRKCICEFTRFFFFFFFF